MALVILKGGGDFVVVSSSKLIVIISSSSFGGLSWLGDGILLGGVESNFLSDKRVLQSNGDFGLISSFGFDVTKFNVCEPVGLMSIQIFYLQSNSNRVVIFIFE